MPQRIVIKLGTQVVMDLLGGADGHPVLAQGRLAKLLQQVIILYQSGHDLLLVTSGAVGLGRRALGLWGSITLPEKQACAAVGQSLLMHTYRELLSPYQIVTAQVLLTADDFKDRTRYLALRDTLEKLLSLRVIPILNENDVVSIAELQPSEDDEQTTPHEKSFGDNDKLSALIAAKLDADLLVLLTNVDGVYTDNPTDNPLASRIPVISNLDQVAGINTTGQSTYGRGGMTSKLDAARLAALSGVSTLITSGFTPLALTVLAQNLGQLTDTESPNVSYSTFNLPGTLVLPHGRLLGRKRWIALGSGYEGVIVVNAGAKKALVTQQASLLPSGLVKVLGVFKANTVVSIQDDMGAEIGRGLIAYSSQQAVVLLGCHTSTINDLLGPGVYPQELVHRDNLVIF
jgi:glutamate 5-kinase